jgi:hypothetical protein
MFYKSPEILKPLAVALLLLGFGAFEALTHHGLEAWFIGAVAALGAIGYLIDVTKAAGGRMADLGWILLDVALYAAAAGAIAYGFAHSPIPTAILVGAGIVAGAVIYATRRLRCL